MNICLRFVGGADGDDGPFYLGQGSDWSSIREWVESLPDEPRFAPLRTLLGKGYVEDTEALLAGLSAALEFPPPSGHGVQKMLAEMAELVGVGRPEEAAVISEGDDDD